MKVSIVAGTRPEIVKLAPVYSALKNKFGLNHKAVLDTEWIATGQHGDLAEQAMHVFGIAPDIRLSLQWDRHALTSLTSALVHELGRHFGRSRPDFVLVQGDTASAFSGALAAYLNNIPVGHVEAGLRSGNLFHPFPEEGFRKLIAPIADLHFAPTRKAVSQLTNEGIAGNKILLTGNTVIDAVRQVASMDIRPQVLDRISDKKRLVLVTLHRRENWDQGVAGVCSAIKSLRDEYPDVHFVLPVHHNPRVRGPIEAELEHQDRIEIIEPMAYPTFVAVMKRAYLILFDSGGVQEEAPSFGVPVLVMRDETEREEAIQAGVAKLVGADKGRILKEARLLLDNAKIYGQMSRPANPFGDGRAADRIANSVVSFLRSEATDEVLSEVIQRPALPDGLSALVLA